MNIFYKKNLLGGSLSLSEEESKHCALVLRHEKGDPIIVYDGNGGIYHAVLSHINKKECQFEITTSNKLPQKDFSIHLAIAPTKNTDRMEWMIEKLTEIGVDEISFIQTSNSERKKLRMDRLEKKAISAMKQSGNPFLPKMNELLPYKSFVESCKQQVKLIAHVDGSHQYITDIIEPKKNIVILIGPEGDFSEDELKLSAAAGFQTISLGKNTLRTETAGFVACCFVNSVNRV